MINLIGLPLEDALRYLQNNGFKSEIKVNNFCVKENVKLVTNAKTQGDTVVLYVGEFIFDIKEQNNE